MKSWQDKLADKLYLLNKRVFPPDPLANVYRGKEYPLIPASHFAETLLSTLNDIFSAAGYDEYLLHSWFRERSDIFVERLSVSNLVSSLPLYFGVSGYSALRSPLVSQLLGILSGKNRDKMNSLFAVRLVNIFPRDEKIINRKFILNSFASEEAVVAAIVESAKRILECSNRFFEQYNTYEDIIQVFESGHFLWDASRKQFFSQERDETLGILYLITNQSGKALSHFENRILVNENKLESAKPARKAEFESHLRTLQRAIEVIKSGEITAMIEDASRKANKHLDSARV